jgi:hypothetical protein
MSLPGTSRSEANALNLRSLLEVFADADGWAALVAPDENDPQATLAVHRSNGFDADFSPYQSNRLRR